jgi:hypothetical protein
MLKHPQVEVLYDGYQISVDEGIADLLRSSIFICILTYEIHVNTYKISKKDNG